MIDFLHEEILTLDEAARMLPRNPDGTQVHKTTIYRWSSRGIRGVRLESICLGGRRCTTVEALGRFFEALTTATVGATGERREARGDARSARVAAELDRAGF